MSQFEEEAAPRRFFFRKENRILKRADFLRVYGQGQVYRRSLVHVFILKQVPSGESTEAAAPLVGPTRIGITATRKTGKAVHRNRARRLIRESFRHALPDMRPGYEIVVNVTRGTAAAPFAKIDAQLRDIWRQAGVIAPTDRQPAG
jgi:ribonuclease P protein component